MIYFYVEVNMENQINSGDQNTQQIGQNPAIQPVQTSEKPKVNYWMILTLILAIALIILGIFTLSKRTNNKLTNGKLEQKINLSEAPTEAPTKAPTEAPTPSNISTNPNSQLPDDEVFLVTAVVDSNIK